MKLDEFRFDLPDELIAQEPVEPRDHSRLMVVNRRTQQVSHRRFFELPELLPPGCLTVLNDTKVFPARLEAERESGGKVEIFLLHPLDDRRWEVLLRPARRCGTGSQLRVSDSVTAVIDERIPLSGKAVVRFQVKGDFWECLEQVGHVPLPPYIRRPDGRTDRQRYQTVFARHKGSVAAPTAGLHFTPALLERIPHCAITLHVGYGTFQPVRVQEVEAHRMEAEFCRIPSEIADRLNRHRQQGGRIAAVGTTTVRALESACDAEGRLQPFEGWTELYIYPGYRFRFVDCLITNFHLPGSTLLLLAAAFAGKDLILEAYRTAVREGYRFYSYGDAMLIL